MAKKKVTHQEKPSQNPEKQTNQTAAAMEEASEKLESLKYLNAMLLKETVERRQQVDSLKQSNVSLESELTQFKMEKKELESDLAGLGDFAVLMELEWDLIFVFVGVQVGEQAEMIAKERAEFGREKMEIEIRLGSLEREMGELITEKSEIEKVKSENQSQIRLLKNKLSELVVEIKNEKDVSNQVTCERDEMRSERDIQIEETNGLKQKLIETERREKVILEEVEKLRVNYNNIVEEKEDRERKIESITKDKDAIERSIVELNWVIKGLKRETEEMGREKGAVEAERNAKVVKINELENSVTLLKDMVLTLQKEEEKLRGNVAGLEKKCGEWQEKENQMVMEINVLVEENKKREKSLESLIDEKGLIMKDLDKALRQLDEQKGKLEEITKAKSFVDEAKDIGESEIAELKRQVADFKDTIHSLEEASSGEMERIRGLESEVNQYRAAFDRITAEKDEARKGLNEEKMNRMKLRVKISELEKSIEATQKVVGKMKDEESNLIEQKKELESHYTVLKQDLASVENKLADSQNELDNMKAKVGLAEANSEIILNMLRNTATLVSQSTNESEMVDQMEAGEEIKEYLTELESIKKAFKSRESTVEDMKRQLESLQHSEAAHKKSFWTLLTSATTLFAAASVAYVARGH